MEIHVITGLPKLLHGPLNESIIERAQKSKIVKIYIHDIRDYATDKHKQIDDYPYGGGPGMILKPEPVFRCLESIQVEYNLSDTHVTLLTAAGKIFEQKTAVEFSLRDKLVLLCGHYKGIDQRIIDNLVTEQISIGDFILTGGELPAMCVIDAVVRLLPGAIGDFDSADTDSFQTGLLDHPHYTRPVDFRGMKVPEVLTSGHHEKIEKWQKARSLAITEKLRPDLYNKYVNSD
ncbi:tRNA (guanosine(37)-N1)-methyltransferase TrmD [candidate division KSB1 bacterium]|nr:tRNA (guanosine(37)-N1)-methyltransferase TrmD [candidate division KSB1 bacterium]